MAGTSPAMTPAKSFDITRMRSRSYGRNSPSALWRLAIDAGADRRRYRLGLAAHPRRNDRAEAAGRASRGHDQEMIRRFERGVDTLAAVAHDRALPHVGPFSAAHTGAFVQEVGDITLGPARPLDRLRP